MTEVTAPMSRHKSAMPKTSFCMHLFFEGQQWKIKEFHGCQGVAGPQRIFTSSTVLPVKILVGML
jgi:hypothetical protein